MNIRKTALLAGCFVLTFLPLHGCSFSEEHKVREALEADLDQLKSSDLNTIQNCIDTQKLLPSSEESSENTEQIAEIIRLFYKNFSYDIEKITVHENQAQAYTEFTTLNAKAAAKDYAAASLQKHIEEDAAPQSVRFSLEDSYALLKEVLETQTHKPKTFSTEITLEKKENDWKVRHTEELDRLLTGNFLSYISDSQLLSPSEIVEIHFRTIQSFDSEQLKRYLSLDQLFHTEDPYNASVVQALTEQISQFFNYKILKEKKNGSQAFVTASVTSLDFQSIVTSYQKQLSKWLKTSESLAVGSQGRREKERQLLLTAIQNNKKAYSQEIQLQLYNDTVNWKILMNDQLSTAIFGDIASALDSLT